MKVERCQLCGDLTDRAGRADDSIYRDAALRIVIGMMRFEPGDEIGPLCEACRDSLQQLKVIED